MKNIFIGLILTLLELSIFIETGTIGFVPAPIGFWLIYKGLAEECSESWRFSEYKSKAIILVAVSSAEFVLNIFRNINLLVAVIALICGIAKIIMLFRLVYKIIDELRGVEIEYRAELELEKLEKIWNITAGALALAFIFFFVPVFAVILSLISAAASVVFLFFFNKTQKAYYSAIGSNYYRKE